MAIVDNGTVVTMMAVFLLYIDMYYPNFNYTPGHLSISVHENGDSHDAIRAFQRQARRGSYFYVYDGQGGCFSLIQIFLY